jgi:hypothetical protein
MKAILLNKVASPEALDYGCAARYLSVLINDFEKSLSSAPSRLEEQRESVLTS